MVESMPEEGQHHKQGEGTEHTLLSILASQAGTSGAMPLNTGRASL